MLVQKSKNAFTMIELIFVIVILGILAAVALPKLEKTKRQADIVSGRADVATIRSAIVNERQTQLVKGNASYIPNLSDNSTTLFTGSGTVPTEEKDHNRTLMMYGIKAGSQIDGWTAKDGAFLVYDYTVNGTKTEFIYTPVDGKFMCAEDTADCNALAN